MIEGGVPTPRKRLVRSLSKSVGVCDDFYDHVCTGFQQAHTVNLQNPEHINADTLLFNRMEEVLHKIITEKSFPEAEKLFNLYNACRHRTTPSADAYKAWRNIKVDCEIKDWPYADTSESGLLSKDVWVAAAKVSRLFGLHVLLKVTIEPDPEEVDKFIIASVGVCDDFYDHVCTGFQQAHTVNLQNPEHINADTQLFNRMEEVLHKIITATPSADAYKAWRNIKVDCEIKDWPYADTSESGLLSKDVWVAAAKVSRLFGLHVLLKVTIEPDPEEVDKFIIADVWVAAAKVSRLFGLHVLLKVTIEPDPEEVDKFIIALDEPDVLLHKSDVMQDVHRDWYTDAIVKALTVGSQHGGSGGAEKHASSVAQFSTGLIKLLSNTSMTILGTMRYKVITAKDLPSELNPFLDTLLSDNAIPGQRKTHTRILLKSPNFVTKTLLDFVASNSLYAAMNYIGFRLLVELSVYLPEDVDSLRAVWYTQIVDMYRPSVDRWRTCMHSIDRAIPLYLLYVYSHYLNESNFQEVVARMSTDKIGRVFAENVKHAHWMDNFTKYIAERKIASQKILSFYPVWVTIKQKFIEHLSKIPADVKRDVVLSYANSVQHLRDDNFNAYRQQTARLKHVIHSARYGIRQAKAMTRMLYEKNYYYDTGKTFPEMVWSETTAEKFERDVKRCFVRQYSDVPNPSLMELNFLDTLLSDNAIPGQRKTHTRILLKSPNFVTKTLLDFVASNSLYAAMNYIGFRLLVELSVYLPEDVDSLRAVWYTQIVDMYRPSVDRWRTCMHSIDRAIPLYLLYVYSHYLNESNFQEVVARMSTDKIGRVFAENVKHAHWMDNFTKYIAERKIASQKILSFYPVWVTIKQKFIEHLSKIPADVKRDVVLSYANSVQHLRDDNFNAYRQQTARLKHVIHSARYGIRQAKVMTRMLYEKNYYYDTGKTFPEMVWSETTAEKFERDVKRCFVKQYSDVPNPSLMELNLDGNTVYESVLEETAAIGPTFKAFHQLLNIFRIWQRDFRMKHAEHLSSDMLFFIYYALDSCTKANTAYMKHQVNSSNIALAKERYETSLFNRRRLILETFCEVAF
ncbi:hypothetical protein ISCGN_009055 [Ixodes scapularis]